MALNPLPKNLKDLNTLILAAGDGDFTIRSVGGVLSLTTDKVIIATDDTRKKLVCDADYMNALGTEDAPL